MSLQGTHSLYYHNKAAILKFGTYRSTYGTFEKKIICKVQMPFTALTKKNVESQT